MKPTTRTFFVLALFALHSSGCAEITRFRAQVAGISNAAYGATWHGPFPVDLSDVRDPTDYSTAANGNASTSFYGVIGSRPSAQSFGTFQLQSSPEYAVLAGSFWDGQFFRAFGRAYNPHSQSGTGWASYGPQASFLDAAPATNSMYSAFGIGYEGAGLAVFADGSARASVGNALLDGTRNWMGMRSQLGTTASAAIPAVNIIPGQGYVPTLNAHAGYHVNGKSTSLAWDQGGHAFYSFIDVANPDFIGYSHRYTAFTQWDADARRLGPLTQQVDVLSDGFGVTQFWVGQDLLQATQISMGLAHTCAATERGLACWGLNADGQAGFGSGGGNSGQYPMVIRNIGAITQSAGGAAHTCAITQAGSTYCWGANDHGQIGNNNPGSNVFVPYALQGITGRVVQIATGASHSCAVTDGTSGNDLYCWGSNDEGQLLLATTVGTDAPAPLNMVGNIEQIALGNAHTCLLAQSGGNDVILCFGRNAQGQLGDGNTTSPGAGFVQGLPAAANIAQLVAGGENGCALVETSRTPIGTILGDVYCWGDNGVGQLLTNSLGTFVSNAVRVDQNATSISVGANNICSVHGTEGAAYCWGDNSFGQIGNGATGGSVTTPTQVALPPGSYATSITAGNGVTCATTSLSSSVDMHGPVFCWGVNTSYQVTGNTTTPAVSIPLPQEIPASTHQSLHASWSADPNSQYKTLSTGDVKNMASASDAHGNVLAVYLQTDPSFVAAPTGTVSATFPIRNSNVRVYASARGASGVWSGPTRIDDAAQISTQTTTTFQDAWGRETQEDARITGGIEYFTPAVAYVGNGVFLAAFAMTDLTLGTSAIYARKYIIGKGWEPATETVKLDTHTLSGATLEPYRYANELHLSGDGQGNALLSAQVVVPSGDASDVTLRNFGMKTFLYSELTGGWSQDSFLIPSSFCPATSAVLSAPAALNFCWNLKPQGMVFPGGESVVVFPAPADPYSTDDDIRTNLRLFSTEFHL